MKYFFSLGSKFTSLKYVSVAISITLSTSFRVFERIFTQLWSYQNIENENFNCKKNVKKNSEKIFTYSGKSIQWYDMEKEGSLILNNENAKSSQYIPHDWFFSDFFISSKSIKQIFHIFVIICWPYCYAKPSSQHLSHAWFFQFFFPSKAIENSHQTERKHQRTFKKVLFFINKLPLCSLSMKIIKK